MKRLLIVGCGDVARRAIPWLVRRFRVYALVRGQESVSELRAQGVRAIIGDLDERKSIRRLAGLADAVLHCAPPPKQGRTDTRTANLMLSLSGSLSVPQHLVYISTTGVYGDCGGAWVDECTPCRPRTERAARRVDAEQRLRSFGRRRATCVSILRAPGIYGQNRLPLGRLQRGDPVLVSEQDVYTNHIHGDDLARLACMALFRGRCGRVYNAVDNSCLKMGDYFDFAADLFALPRPPRLARAELETRLSALSLSFFAESRRIRNLRLRRELRLTLCYPTVHQGLSALRQMLEGSRAC